MSEIQNEQENTFSCLSKCLCFLSCCFGFCLGCYLGCCPFSSCFLYCGFFCPPCNKKITEKIIFRQPFPPNYKLVISNADLNACKFELSPKIDITGLSQVLKTRAHFIKTSLGNDIAVLYINCNQEKKYTVLFSHGNAEDLGQMYRICAEMSTAFNCDFICYDYSGYGQSKGEPTEENLYADIKAAWNYTLDYYEARAEKIILFGYSLGTVPTIDLASKVQCAGVILQSPFKSTLSVVCSNQNLLSCMDRFRNIEKMPKITSPVLVIHGTNDRVINISHGQAIYERCPQAVEPLWIEGAGHNDIGHYEQYTERIQKFINEELPS